MASTSLIGLDEEKAVEQGDDNGGHLDDSGFLSADVLREHAERKAHESAGQGGDGDHESDLALGEMKLFCDERAHGAVQYPDRKAEIEVEECGEEGWRMSRL